MRNIFFIPFVLFTLIFSSCLSNSFVYERQKQIMHLLHKEQEGAFISILNARNKAYQDDLFVLLNYCFLKGFSSEKNKLLVQRREKHRIFQEQLKIARDDYYHDPCLSQVGSDSFKIFCKELGYSPYAFDIRFAEMEGDIVGEAKLERRNWSFDGDEYNPGFATPVIYLKKMSYCYDETYTLLHEIAHFYFGHLIDGEMLGRLGAFDYDFTNDDAYILENYKKWFEKCIVFKYVHEYHADLLQAIISSQEYAERYFNHLIRQNLSEGYIRGIIANKAKFFIDYALHREDFCMHFFHISEARSDQYIAQYLYARRPKATVNSRSKIMENYILTAREKNQAKTKLDYFEIIRAIIVVAVGGIIGVIKQQNEASKREKILSSRDIYIKAEMNKKIKADMKNFRAR